MKGARHTYLLKAILLFITLFLPALKGNLSLAEQEGLFAAPSSPTWKKFHLKAAPPQQLNGEDGQPQKPLLARRQGQCTHDFIPGTGFRFAYPDVAIAVSSGGFVEHLFFQQKRLLFPVHWFW
ncbi:hypothetical protein [Parasegetibacter sp. NRK P23]|uniref:hypothetical protein n=1 Tax=Parasegetibacter sp. NRK P23 TaxID=2942999 RepID=UPI0020430774|nr:hypothetical protein [Parasegetibacter sp. NRK P23]MCM5530597.1 hypothetical protein [Parasegetibacter sp. NRK P23]